MYSDSNYHIVYASDDNFAEILGVSIVSLFENNQSASSITIYILDSGISEENKRLIEDVCNKYDRTLPIWIKATNIEEKLGIAVNMDRGSLSQYARLFVSSSIPNEVNRVLYLDCDIIINKPLFELWNLDLQGKTIGALMDAFSRYYRANIELNQDDIMFNSGVMLIDLTLWKKNCIEDKLMAFIKRHNGKIQQGDQGALNAVLSHETYCIEPKFNSVTIFYDFTYEEMLAYRKPPYFYPKEEVEKAVSDPVIIHYTTSFLSRRPWCEGCEHRYKDRWLFYKEISPWKEAKLRPYKSTKYKEAALFLYNILPSGIAVKLVGLLQIYARPMKNKLTKKINRF